MTDYDHLLGLEAGDDLPPSMIELERIPRRAWAQVLAPLSWRQRLHVAQRVRDERLRRLASELAQELDRAETRRVLADAEARLHERLTTAVSDALDAAEYALMFSVVQTVATGPAT